MARRPPSDIRTVTAALPMPAKGERFFVTEIARMLRCRASVVTKFLEKRGMLWLLKDPQRARAYWTSARGLQLVIVHVRALQGAPGANGKGRADSAH